MKVKLSKMGVGDLAIFEDEVVVLKHTEQSGGYDYLATVCDVRNTIELYRDYPNINIDDIPELIADIGIDGII